MASAAEALLEQLDQAVGESLTKELGILSEQADKSTPLVGADLEAYNKSVEVSTQLMRQRKSAEAAVAHERAARQLELEAEAEMSDLPRSGGDTPERVSVGELMQKFGRHDKGFIQLGGLGVSKRYSHGRTTNQAFSGAVSFADGVPDTKTRGGDGFLPLTSAPLPGKGRLRAGMHRTGADGTHTEELSLIHISEPTRPY